MDAPLPALCRLAAVALALAMGACTGPTHTSDTFGRAGRDAFKAQQPPPAARPPPPSMALDTQEAHVIAGSYVQGLSGKSKEKAEPVLFIDPQQQQPAALAPSVPRY